MSKIGWKGVMPVVVTPFDQEGNLVEKDLRTMVRLLIDDGVHGIIAAASTGEYYAMSDEERCRVFRIVAEEARSIKPELTLVAHTTSLIPDNCIQMSGEARKLGYDGVMIMPPTYATPSRKQIIDNYRYLGANIDLPIMLYNAPKWTCTNLEPSWLEELVKIENVKAIKESSRNIEQLLETIRIFHDDLAIFVGLETMIVPTMALGGDGVVAMFVQAMGRAVVTLYELCVQGRYDEARKLQWAVSRMYGCYKHGTHYATIKEACNQVGRPACYPRRPLTLPSEEEKVEIGKILKELGLK